MLIKDIFRQVTKVLMLESGYFTPIKLRILTT